MKEYNAKEFKSLVNYIIDIEINTERAFHGTSTISVRKFVKSLITSADV